MMCSRSPFKFQLLPGVQQPIACESIHDESSLPNSFDPALLLVAKCTRLQETEDLDHKGSTNTPLMSCCLYMTSALGHETRMHGVSHHR